MARSIEWSETIPVRGSAEILVSGGGLAGCAAALAGARAGKRVILMEKSLMLGGLGTIGLINLFVPMCNGRGKQILCGMAEEFLRLSIRDGFDTLPAEWKNGEPAEKTDVRYMTRFSPQIFAMGLTDLLADAGVKILFDTAVTQAVMEGPVCRGLIVENKSGRGFYEGKMIVDATGDSDVLCRAGVPTRQGKNYHSYFAMEATLKSCEEVLRSGDIGRLYAYRSAANATLYGAHHPEGLPFYSGTDGEDVSDYVIRNQKALLASLRQDPDRKSRDIVTLPAMPQFRTTRCLCGDYALSVRDKYRHFADSITAINDFDNRDFLYEVPLRCVTHHAYPNFFAAGRCASGSGYGWDLLRVIPPAIATGQGCGIAAALAIDTGKAAADLPLGLLQEKISSSGIMVHFPDSLIPAEPVSGAPEATDHF